MSAKVVKTSPSIIVYSPPQWKDGHGKHVEGDRHVHNSFRRMQVLGDVRQSGYANTLALDLLGPKFNQPRDSPPRLARENDTYDT